MNPRTTKLIVLAQTLALALFVVLAGSTATHAEVGALLGPSSPETDASPYILGIIEDGPDPWENRTIAEATDPWGALYAPVRPHAPDRAILNPDGDANRDGVPALLLHPTTRRTMAVYARNAPQGYDVVLSVLESTGWSTPTVLGDAASDALGPRLAVDPANGDVHLFYWERSDPPSVWHRQAPADLSSWSPPARVSGADEAASRPWSTVFEGELYVAYERHGFGFENTPREVVLARRVGTAFEPEVVAVTSFSGANRPQVHAAEGRLWIDWVDAEGELAWTVRRPDGTWTTVETAPFDGNSQLEWHVRGRSRVDALGSQP